MSDPFSITRAEANDAEKMMGVSHRAQPNFSKTRERMERTLSSGASLLVAHHYEDVIGYSINNELAHLENTAFINVLVDPEHQGSGVGTALFAAAREHCSENIKTITTWVDSTDERARAVAEHWGFTARETEPPDITEETYRLLLADLHFEHPFWEARERSLDLLTLADLLDHDDAMEDLKRIAAEGDHDRPRWDDGVDQSFDPVALTLGDETIEPKLSPVLLDYGTPLAVNFVSPKAHIAHIAFAAAARASRGRGLGTLVAKASLALAREAGADRATITTRTDNDAMQSVIHNLGFERFELIPMQRSLP